MSKEDTHVNWATSDDKMMDGIMALFVIVGVGLNYMYCTDTRLNGLQLKLFSGPLPIAWTAESVKVTTN